MIKTQVAMIFALTFALIKGFSMILNVVLFKAIIVAEIVLSKSIRETMQNSLNKMQYMDYK